MPTIRDVARASRVSIATVSRVFNDSPLVTEHTRRRVLASASRLGYWPNSIARSLITNRTHTLGVVMPDLFGEFFSEVVHGMDLAARERGYHLLVSRSSSNPGDLAETLRTMRGRVDGLALMAPDFDASRFLHEGPAAVPTVLLNPESAPLEADSVSIANFEGASEVVRHLIALGHRRIAHIGGPPGNIDARQRRDGYRDALRQAGIVHEAELELPGDFAEGSGFRAAAELLRRAERPTAIFAANDYMAVGALGALHDAGVRVPEEMALVGFDDIALARSVTPPLTTVHVDMMELGRRAVVLLLERGERPGAPDGRHEVLATTLIVRGSCGAGAPIAGGPRFAGGGPHGASPPRRHSA